MEFHRPADAKEAAMLLATGKRTACLAGGGLLTPTLQPGPRNSAERPEALISLRSIPSLHELTHEEGHLRIGAMVCHAKLAGEPSLVGGLALLAQAARHIAHPAIRNMATIGGSLCAADPASDYAGALVALGAHVELLSIHGVRTLPIASFWPETGGTARRQDELVTALLVPLDETSGTSGYERLSRVDGDYPCVTAAVRLGWRDDRIVQARVGIGGCGLQGMEVEQAAATLLGLQRGALPPAETGEACRKAARPQDDLRASATYRDRMIPVLVRRALVSALTMEGTAA